MTTDIDRIIEGFVCFLRKFNLDTGGVILLDPAAGPGHSRIPPGCHFHESWELRACWGGKYLFRTPDKELVIPENHVLLIPPGAVHVIHGYNLEKQRKKVTCLYVTFAQDAFVAGVQTKQWNWPHYFTSNQRVKLADLLFGPPETFLEKIMSRSVLPADRHQQIYYHCLIKLLLSSILELLSQPEPNERTSSEDAAVKVLEFLKGNYSIPQLSLEDIARQVRLTPTYLANIYKRHFGKTIKQTLIDIRLEKARTLLQKQNFSVKEVSYLTGWTSPLYFSKVYHKRYGFPPSEGRNGN